MYFIKHFTILVLLAVQYSFQDETTAYPTTPGCTYDCVFSTTQGVLSDVVARKKRSSLKEKLEEVNEKTKNLVGKAKSAGMKAAKKTKNAFDKFGEKVELQARKAF